MKIGKEIAQVEIAYYYKIGEEITQVEIAYP